MLNVLIADRVKSSASVRLVMVANGTMRAKTLTHAFTLIAYLANNGLRLVTND